MGPSKVLFVLATATAALGAMVPRDAPTTVTATAPYQGASPTATPSLAEPTLSIYALATASAAPAILSSGGNVMLGPVSNPSRDPSDLSNIVPTSNLTMHYGSNDTSTPPSNALITLQMKKPTVLLEDISSVKSVVCSDTGVLVTFDGEAGYEKSKKEWPSSGDFFLVTNHLGNCDTEFERGMFTVVELVFNESTLTVDAKAEKSDIQSTAGSMQIDFGQVVGSVPEHSTTSHYSNTTTKRAVYDETYTFQLDTSISPDTKIASLPPLFVTANKASFTGSVKFSGHIDYNFWHAKFNSLYVDLDVALDANLELNSSIQASYSNTFSYAPPSVALTPITIPLVLTLGPALNLEIGAQVGSNGQIDIITDTEVNLLDGYARLDLLNSDQSTATGWTPTSSVSASLDVKASLDLNPYVQLDVDLGMNILDGLMKLSAGVKANATLANTLTSAAGTSAETSTGVSARSGQDNGSCSNGVDFKSDFIFAITGYAGSYNHQLYSADVPLFDKCLSVGSS